MSADRHGRRALLERLAERFAASAEMTEAERRLICELSGETRRLRRGEDLVDDADPRPRIILEGWACQARTLPNGRRQIFGFCLPGDFIGSFWPQVLPAPPYRVIALTRLETLEADTLLSKDSAGVHLHGGAVAACRKAEQSARGLLFDHIVRLGARDAYGGLAHLFLELHVRLCAVGLAGPEGFELPIGQRILAEAMGFSVAHLNHTLQRMAGDGLILALGKSMRLLQPGRLATLAGLEGAPLALDVAPRRGGFGRQATGSPQQ